MYTWNESRKCMLLPANCLTAHFVFLSLSSESGVVVVPGTSWFWCHPRHMAPSLEKLGLLVFLEALIMVGSVLMNLLSLLSVLCHLKSKNKFKSKTKSSHYLIVYDVHWVLDHDISISNALFKQNGFLLTCQFLSRAVKYYKTKLCFYYSWLINKDLNMFCYKYIYLPTISMTQHTV
jgi:hypothetical protein